MMALSRITNDRLTDNKKGLDTIVIEHLKSGDILKVVIIRRKGHWVVVGIDADKNIYKTDRMEVLLNEKNK